MHGTKQKIQLLKFTLLVGPANSSWWLIHLYETFQRKFLLLFRKAYYAKSFRLTALEQQMKTQVPMKMQCILNRCLSDTENAFTQSTPEGFSSMKTAIIGRQFTITEVHFLSIILTNDMYLYGHPSEEIRLIMKWKWIRGIRSTSAKNGIPSEVLTDTERSPMPKTYHSFWSDWVKTA